MITKPLTLSIPLAMTEYPLWTIWGLKMKITLWQSKNYGFSSCKISLLKF